MYTEQLTFAQIRRELVGWCDEYGICPSDDMSYPFEADCKSSIALCLWRMHQEGRVNTMRGLRAYFDRYVRARGLEPIA